MLLRRYAEDKWSMLFPVPGKPPLATASDSCREWIRRSARYRLVELLGRGGMGEVWRAKDIETDRIVAIKLLSAYLSEDEGFQRRFRREAHAAARLNSPHVIPIHNYGEIDGRRCVDMRLIEGRDLQSVLADGPLDPTRGAHPRTSRKGAACRTPGWSAAPRHQTLQHPAR